jgi:hypothetical protein
LRAVPGIHRLQQGGGFVTRLLLQRREDGVARFGECQQALPAVVRARRAHQPAGRLEALEDAAEVACVQPQVMHQVACDDARALGQFVQHADVGKRQFAAEVRVEYADAAGEEAVEAAHRLDGFGRNGVGEGGGRHRRFCSQQLA